jgi:hypothetical protein
VQKHLKAQRVRKPPQLNKHLIFNAKYFNKREQIKSHGDKLALMLWVLCKAPLAMCLLRLSLAQATTKLIQATHSVCQKAKKHLIVKPLPVVV